MGTGILLSYLLPANPSDKNSVCNQRLLKEWINKGYMFWSTKTYNNNIAEQI